MSGSGIIGKLFDDTDKSFARKRNILTFTVLGVFLMVSGFVVGRKPCYYMKFSSICTLIFLGPRIFQYIRTLWFLYLLDYCYMINLIMIYYAFYGSTPLNNAVLLSSSFYLVINVFRYKNKMVFHHQEYFFTCYMHINPTIALGVSYVNGCIGIAGTYLEILVGSLKLWACYYSVYALLMFFILRPIWTKYNIPNIYSYHKEDPFYKHKFERFGPTLVVGATQFVFVVAATVAGYIVFQDYYVFVVFCFIYVMYTLSNAATYYLDYLPAVAVKESKKSS